MRFWLLTFCVVQSGFAFAQDNAATMSVDDIRRACGAGSSEYCQMSYDTIADDHRKAFAGDYGGQRNIAYCLSYGCDDATIVQPEYGCAWRMVIAAADHAQFDAGDKLNLQVECGRLSETGRFRSAVQAAILFDAIYGRKMPELKLN